jgi:hypothetical protein
MVAQAQSIVQPKIEFEAIEDRASAGDWRVEGINFAGDGEVYTAIFTGPLARERAVEYAAWKNENAPLPVKTQPQRQ